MLERFGPYRLVRRLATGGMAEVFLARQEGVAGFRRLAVVKRRQDAFSWRHRCVYPLDPGGTDDV